MQEVDGGRYYSIGVQDAASKEWRQILRLPSVTTILGMASKDALPAWSANLTVDGIATLLQKGEIKPGHKPSTIKTKLKDAKLRYSDVRDAAADRGTIAHDFVEQLIVFGVDGINIDELDPWSAGLARWWKVQAPSVVKNEVAVVSLKRGYAGRMDLLAGLRGTNGLTLVDFKTVKDTSYFTRYPSAYESNRVQLVVYRDALIEEDPDLEINHLMVVRLAEGQFHQYLVPPETWPIARDYFEGCLRIWKYRQKCK